jgi:uncharacterized membrane protein
MRLGAPHVRLGAPHVRLGAPHVRLGAFFVFAGAMHFLTPRPYIAIVPDALPRKREIVYISGVAELAGGAGVLIPATRRAAAWWLILTLIAIFPANLNMAVNADRFTFVAEPLLWARLPVQGALIAWVWRAALR